nr:MAG TPA: hypothetical protein [Caudoviricetes sp.]
MIIKIKLNIRSINIDSQRTKSRNTSGICI